MLSNLQSLWWLAIFIHWTTLVSANVEKVIFIAPGSTPLTNDAAIDNLLLLTLHSHNSSLRTYLDATFPTDNQPHGAETWALLYGLNPGQRYELRVCWLATQPTAFWLDTFTIDEAFGNADLISSLSVHARRRHQELAPLGFESITNSYARTSDLPPDQSLLFLRIQAAADYFSLDKNLMDTVPPVHVDLILDPYILNAFPRSLGPTATYIVTLAVIAWFLSAWVARNLSTITQKTDHAKKSD